MRNPNLALVSAVFLWSLIVFAGTAPRKATAELGVIPVSIYLSTTSTPPPIQMSLPPQQMAPILQGDAFDPHKVKTLKRATDYWIYAVIEESVEEPADNYLHLMVYTLRPGTNHQPPRNLISEDLLVSKRDVYRESQQGQKRQVRSKLVRLKLKLRGVEKNSIVVATVTGFRDKPDGDHEYPVALSKTWKATDEETDENGKKR